MLSKATPAMKPLAWPVSRRLRYEAGRIPHWGRRRRLPPHGGSTGRSAHGINPPTSLPSQARRTGGGISMQWAGSAARTSLPEHHPTQTLP